MAALESRRKWTLDEIYRYSHPGLSAELNAARLMGQEALVAVITPYVLELLNAGNSLTYPMVGGGFVALVLETSLLQREQNG